MTCALETGRPAVILDPTLGGRFVAQSAVIEDGWLHAVGFIRRVQAGDLPDVTGPVVERSWSPTTPIRIEWGSGR
jgi:hypothetical protein